MSSNQLAMRAIFGLLLVVGLVQPLIGLNPEPKIEEQASKYSPTSKEDNVIADSGETSTSDVFDQSFEDENRITISEPYMTLIQTTARFAVAQSSLTDYVTVDTFMDVVSDTSYALSKPSTLSKAFKTVAILIITLLTSAFVMPASLMQTLRAILNNPDRLLQLEKHLPSGLNEMGIISLLNEKTDEFLGRLRLNDSSCRQQSVCQTGELIRCAFPRASKVAINFITKNFSRPKYRSNNKYLDAFLTGFIDQKCAKTSESDNNSAQARSCASNFIKSLSLCPTAQKSAPTPSASPKSGYQSIRAMRASLP